MPLCPSFHAVRDLLGVVRTLYRTSPCEELARAGKSLANASELLESPPGSLGYKAALRQVEQACDVLEELPKEQSLACVITAVRAVRPLEMN